jgi:peptidylprolyl isomerase
VTALSISPFCEGVSVSRRTRRVLPLVLPLLLVGLGVSSCGDDSGSDESSGDLSSVTIKGDVGTNPEVSFDGKVEVDKTVSKVITEGDGEEIKAGDSVLAHIWIGNGFTQEKSLSTYEEEPKTPQLLTADEKMLSPLFVDGLVGHTIGSRVAVASTAEEAFGPQGNAQLKIGNKDTVVAVIDLLSSVPDGPEGDDVKAPSWAPKIAEKDGVPTSLDFAGTPKPTKKLQSATLIQGEGETVEKGQLLVVNYLGQVYGGKKPFDESYSTGQPASFPIGTGGVIPGWDKALVGQKLGSRVMLSIPPEDGYGKAGNEQAGIKGTDTLYFVVDLLAAA